MSQLVYQVYVGERRPLFERCIESVEAYCKRHGLTHSVQYEPLLRIKPNPETSGRSDGATRLGYLPIFEKENALGMLGPYEQVAVIDADVFIQPDAPNVFDELGDMDFAGVEERSAPITPQYRAKLDRYERGQYGPLGGLGLPLVNMGVMVMNASLRRLCPEEPREFLEREEFQGFIDGRGAWKWSTDQTLLNWWLSKYKARVTALDWRFNALYGALEDGAVEEAHFVHFFLSEHLSSDDPEVLLRTKGRARV